MFKPSDYVNNENSIIFCLKGCSSLKSEITVKLLGVKLDNKLNFDSHISDLCKKAATQLNVLQRLKQFIGFEERKTLVQSFCLF